MAHHKYFTWQETKSVSIMVTFDKSTEDPVETANHFNEYFSNVASNLLKNLPISEVNLKNYLSKNYPNSFYFYPTSANEIKAIVESLKTKHSSGLDGIPTFLIKSTPSNILSILSFIFSLSKNTAKYISSFKMVKVLPIFKKGNPKLVQNYRPIRLLPLFSKILKKFWFNRLYAFSTEWILF